MHLALCTLLLDEKVGRGEELYSAPLEVLTDAECLACVGPGLGPFHKRQNLLSLVML